nr:hypothetical protein [Tanacetum cinerariifolium]
KSKTRLIKRLLYDNSFPHPPEEFISENFDAAIESFSPFPIPVEDSDSFMEEIDLSFTPDDPMPLGIEEDDYDSERDILILEELLSNDSLSLSKNESFYFDIPSSSRPPAKPPDGNSEILNVKVMGRLNTRWETMNSTKYCSLAVNYFTGNRKPFPFSSSSIIPKLRFDFSYSASLGHDPGGQDIAVDKDVDEQPVQDLALNVDNVFQADDCDAFDSNVDEASTAQTMSMTNLSSTNLSSTDPIYDSDILSEVHDHDQYQDAMCEHHEVHEMHDDVQPNYVVDSHADYTSNSNMIPYDQYVKYNAVPIVQNNVSSVPNDAYMMILNDMHEQLIDAFTMYK